MFNTITSFLAVAGAGFVNALVMRSSELQTGIEIYNADMESVGFSKRAAW